MFGQAVALAVDALAADGVEREPGVAVRVALGVVELVAADARPGRSGERAVVAGPEFDVVDLVERKADDLELVLTGGHERPEYVTDYADLVTEIGKEKHPIDAGQPARKGTEY